MQIKVLEISKRRKELYHLVFYLHCCCPFPPILPLPPTRHRMITYTQATIKTVVTGSMMDHECLRMKCEYACVSASKVKDTIKTQEIQTETF